MKIMFVTNNPKFEYHKQPKMGWNLFPSLFTNEGQIVYGVNKSKLLYTYSEYKKFQPSIISTTWTPACFIAALLRKVKLIKCPVIFNWDDYYAEQMTNYPYFIVNFMEKFTAKNCDLIITISKYNHKKAKEMGLNSLYIPPGYFNGFSNSNINLKELKTKQKNFVIVYLGDQSKYKKVDKLIKAVKNLNCDLFLLGDINKKFKEFASENVHFLGYIPELEVRSILKQADILVNTSNQDCSYKLFEYISIKKPIIAFEGKASKILKHGINGFLTKDFRQGIIELIQNKPLLNKIKNNVKKIKVLTWEEVAEKHINIYNNLIKEKMEES